MHHIPEDLIDEYARGRLAENQTPSLEEHLLICHECRERLRLADELIQALRSAHRKRNASGSQ